MNATDDEQLRWTKRRAANAATDRQLQRSLLQSLNEVVSVATRRVFQSQLLHQALASPSAIREQLPELCAFVDELFRVPAATDNTTSTAPPPSRPMNRNAVNVRCAFRDPQAQWLTRSAAQSGVTALLGGQLLRCAEEHFAARQDLAPARLVIVLLCDQLFTPCTLRLDKFSRKCEWRDRKPAYHAMPCFSTWDTLFPFLERMARRFPQVLEYELDVYDMYTAESQQDMLTRANCNFAHVVGLWRLLEALGDSSNNTPQGSSTPVFPVQVSTDIQAEDVMLSLLSSILRFTARVKVLDIVSERQAAHEDPKSAAFYDDLLMDKFFAGLQEFMFSCPRSKKIAADALRSSIVESVTQCAHIDARTDDKDSVSAALERVPLGGLAMFTGVACVFVKGIAGSIATSLIENLKGLKGETQTDYLLLAFIVGFCAHVDLVPIDAIFQLLAELLDTYTTAQALDQGTRTQALFYMVYVAIHRTDAVPDNIRDQDADESDPYVALLNFQHRFSGEVVSEDFYAMPIEWMAILWKTWFAFSDDDLASFLAGFEEHQHHRRLKAQENRELSVQDQHQAISMTIRLQSSYIAFRDADDGVFVRQMQLLRPHFIGPSHVEKLLSSSFNGEPDNTLRRFLSDTLYGQQQQQKPKNKKRRTGYPVDAEAEERKLNVLLLPEVMERVCSFMSAKRLCRLAQVCQGFAEISRSGRLWQGLLISFTSREIEATFCSHGSQYHHDWLRLYRERWEARRRLRKKQRAINTTHQRRLLEQDPDSLDVPTAMVITEIQFTARLCHFCGCNQVLSSQTQVDEHLRLHTQFKCVVVDVSGCGATFTSLAQLKKHVKEQHPEQVTAGAVAALSVKKAKLRIDCAVDGCTRSYTSQKRLASHRRLKHLHGGAIGGVAGAE